MLSSFPASTVNQKSADSGIPPRFGLNSSRSSLSLGHGGMPQKGAARARVKTTFVRGRQGRVAHRSHTSAAIAGSRGEQPVISKAGLGGPQSWAEPFAAFLAASLSQQAPSLLLDVTVMDGDRLRRLPGYGRADSHPLRSSTNDGNRAWTTQTKSAPANAGTKHVASVSVDRRRLVKALTPQSPPLSRSAQTRPRTILRGWPRVGPSRGCRPCLWRASASPQG
jgi:hypothetical protein